jgi:hypothetical protein
LFSDTKEFGIFGGGYHSYHGQHNSGGSMTTPPNIHHAPHTSTVATHPQKGSSTTGGGHPSGMESHRNVRFLTDETPETGHVETKDFALDYHKRIMAGIDSAHKEAVAAGHHDLAKRLLDQKNDMEHVIKQHEEREAKQGSTRHPATPLLDNPSFSVKEELTVA